MNAADLTYIDRLKTALPDIVDDDPCRLDHHGYCQAHRLSKPCINAKALEVLAEPVSGNRKAVRRQEREQGGQR